MWTVVRSSLVRTIYPSFGSGGTLSSRTSSRSAATSFFTQKRALWTTDESKNRAENANLLRFVEAYRTYGHIVSKINPLEPTSTVKTHPLLDASSYGLDPNKSYNLAGILYTNSRSATLEEITKLLDKIYGSNIAIETTHIESPEEKEWLAKKVESNFEDVSLSVEEKKKVHRLLLEAELFDKYMQLKFSTTKRYALEGCEVMITALDTIFDAAAQSNISDIVIGMPHRGRLNLLAGLLKMDPVVIFAKAKGLSEIPEGVEAIGDVLSHLAISSDLQYSSPVHVSLLHNPSHLEAVNPVTVGKARSKQTILGDSKREKVLPIQIHGDAAFAGQGVVFETLQLSQLPGFTTGGSVHIIVNNQIGFTTEPSDGRSSRYSSDVGKVIGTPIFHINADEPEAVVKAVKVALEYRNVFKKDVIIDLIGYRRHGHNEVDEPAFTQPSMYANIRARKSVVSSYTQRLLAEGIITEDEVKQQQQAIQAKLDENLKQVPEFKSKASFLQGRWSGFTNEIDLTQPVATGVARDTLVTIGNKSVDTHGLTIHRRLDTNHRAARLKRIESNELDWATAEAMAFGSLLAEGYNVRISGQDVGRGTFSHRHVVLVDQNTQQKVIPLNELGLGKQGKIEPVNSNLSELAVMAYEYGYSINDPFTLPIWEAQFGDFNNQAQVTIDQFISSSESKWLRQTGMVLLLPHGMDGAGPEHSSCRIERFLQLVDSDSIDINYDRNINLQVINPTTPANYFHALRRQMVRKFRKPLVVVAPKTLLRLGEATSKLEELETGTSFQTVIPDGNESASNIIFCTGKYYYDLVKAKTPSTSIIRLEELAPFPYKALEDVVSKYSKSVSFYWVQEEHQNMGAWSYVAPRIAHIIKKHADGSTITYIGRGPCPAPAVGTAKKHQDDAKALLEKVKQL